MKEIHKIVGIIIESSSVLMCKKFGEEYLIMPGGKPNPGESPRQTLARELKEELGVELTDMDHLYGNYEGNHPKDPGTVIKADAYKVKLCGTLQPQPGDTVKAIQWINSRDVQHVKLGPVNSQLLSDLISDGSVS